MLKTTTVNSTTNIYDLLYNEYFIVEFSSLDSSLPSWLVFAFTLYLVGLLGILLNQKNFLVTMMATELMYLGAIASLVLYGTMALDPQGLLFGLLLLIVAACESAIGLGILIVLYRFGHTIDLDDYQTLGG